MPARAPPPCFTPAPSCCVLSQFRLIPAGPAPRSTSLLPTSPPGAPRRQTPRRCGCGPVRGAWRDAWREGDFDAGEAAAGRALRGPGVTRVGGGGVTRDADRPGVTQTRELNEVWRNLRSGMDARMQRANTDAGGLLVFQDFFTIIDFLFHKN